MVEKSESIAPQSEGSVPKPEKILASMDWEQRLAAARAQRAEIQAELSKETDGTATGKSANSRPKPWDNVPESPTPALRGRDERSPSVANAATGLEFRKKILGTEFVAESLDWEDRIAKIRDHQNDNPASHKVSSEHADSVQSTSLLSDQPDALRSETPSGLLPSQKGGNRIELLPKGLQQVDRPSAQTVGVVHISSPAEKNRSRIFGWRTAAGFALGAVFGLVIASADALMDAARKARTGFSIAASDAPSVMTSVENRQIPKAEAEVAAPSVISNAIDSPVDQRMPTLLTVTDPSKTQTLAAAFQPVARPDPWTPTQIGVQTEALAETAPNPDMSPDRTAFAALVPNLAEFARSNVRPFTPESEDWFRTATQEPGIIPPAAPERLSVLVEVTLIPSIEMPEFTGSVASANTSSMPELERRGVTGGDRASSATVLTLASTGWVVHSRPETLTSPKHEIRMPLNADTPPASVGNADSPAHAAMATVLADMPASTDEEIIAETDDWFRMNRLNSDTLRLAAPAGFSLSEEEPLNLLFETPDFTSSVSTRGKPPTLDLRTNQENRLPDHFSTVPETPEFVKRSAALEMPEPSPRPASTAPEALDLSGVLVHILAPSSVSDERLDGMADTLKDAGYSIKDPARVSFTIKQSNVRFYSAKDAEVANALAKIVGGTARDFTSFSPSPPKGTIEVWFAGASSSKTRTAKATPPRTKPQRTNRQPSRADQDLIRLRNRLVDQLRRGDHL